MTKLDNSDEPRTLLSVLRDSGLEAYFENFRRNDIDLDLLPELTDDDLKEIGIHSLGHRKRLQRIAGEMAPAARAPARRAPAATTLEKRQVTVLFVDLCDYTGLSHRYSTEEIVGILGVFYQRVDAAIESHGGRIDKHIGDCSVGVFGLEDATGHEARNAAKAALDILQSFTDPIEPFGIHLGVHIGIATGGVVLERAADEAIRPGGYSIAGNAINLASRLADMAEDGQILITGNIRQQLADLAEVEEMGPLRIKGFPQPVPVCRLSGLHEAANPVPVGREAEIAALRAALDAVGGGAGSVHCIRGDAGIGKSTLVAHILDEAAARGHAVASALVLDVGASRSAHPVQTIARRLAGLAAGGAPPAEAFERMRAGGRIDDHTRLFLYLLAGLPLPDDLAPVAQAVDARERHRGQRDALRRLVELAAETAPVVILVEDLHWADRLLRDYMTLLAEAAATLPLMLLMTTRRVVFPIDSELREERAIRDLHTLELFALGEEAAEQLARSVGADVDSQVIRACLERAQGNPLFLRQLLAHTGASRSDEIPDSIQNIIQSRLDQCPERERKLLEAASVLGQVFSFEALQWVSGGGSPHLAPLIETGFVQRRRPDFIFAHALIRDSVYELMISVRRRALHLKAAEWFRETDPRLHAEHVCLAGAENAAQVCLEVAPVLRAQWRPDEALATVERGIALGPEPGLAWALGLLRAELLLDLGQTLAALEAYEARTADAPDTAGRCRAMIGTIGAMRIVDRIDDAHALLDAAQALAEAEGLAAELSHIHYFRGALHFPAGRTEECLAEHQRAVACADRAGAIEQKCRALSGLGDAHYARGRMKTAHKVFEECLSLARAHEFRRIEAANLFMLGTVRIYLNDTEGALKDAVDSVEIARKTGAHRAEIVSRLTAGWIQISMDALDAADDNVQTGLEVARTIGAKRFEPFLTESAARIAFLRGRRDEAERLIASAVEGVRGGGERFVGPWLLGTFARITTDAAARQAALDEAESLLAQGCVGHNYYRFHHAAMSMAAELRDAALLRRHADALAAYTAPEPVPWADYHVERARVIADILDGARPADALAARMDALARTAQAARFALASTLDAPFRQMLAGRS